MPNHNKRLHPRERVELILQAAIEVAAETSYKYMTRKDVAARAEVTEPLVSFYFKSMDELRRQVMARAIETPTLIILAHGVINRDTQALAAPKALRTKALRLLVGV